MLNRKISLGAVIAVAAVVAAVTVSITYVYAMDSFNTKVADVNERQAMYTKLSEIDQKARQDYVGALNEKQLIDSICAGYISGLGDTQAKYMSAEKYKDYVSSSAAKTVGVGIRTFKDDDGNMEVMEVIPNSPAEAAGIKRGDVIVTMDDKEIVRMTYGDAYNKLDGMAGTTVRLGVLRPAAPQKDAAASAGVADASASSSAASDGAVEVTAPAAQTLSFTVTRGEYTRLTLSSAVINGNIGYLNISQFEESTAQLFNTELSELLNKSVTGIIIDLRNNAGGSVEAAAAVLDVLLPAGNTVSSKLKDGSVTVEYSSKSNEIALPITVLINGSTFGAAEIFSAAMQDYKKGVLVGEKTPGFGTKDEVIPLSDGSAISLSVANYLRLNGTPFTGVGIAPDVSKSLTEEQAALLSRSQLSAADDPQVQAAVSALARAGASVAQMPGVTANEADAQSTAPEGTPPESTPEQSAAQ